MSFQGHEFIISYFFAGRITHDCNLNIQESEADGSGVLVQPGLHGEITAHIRINRQKKIKISGQGVYIPDI